jgi:uncharacterized damage-inducible protein DinB
MNHRSSHPSLIHQELVKVFDGAQAHATFEQATKDFPMALRGVVPAGLPYSAWQIVQHIRIAQRDILDFSRNHDGSYQEKTWPEDYWTKSAEPPSEAAWDEAVSAVTADRHAFEELLRDTDDEGLTQSFPWGEGQTLLREALLILDHAAYHTGELVVLRRLLGAWK